MKSTEKSVLTYFWFKKQCTGSLREAAVFHDKDRKSQCDTSLFSPLVSGGSYVSWAFGSCENISPKQL